jgi:transcriptional regulator with XRE-family HTH domain
MAVIRRVCSRKIREARIAAGVGTKKLAEMVGVSHPAISQYESGKRTPDANVLGNIAGALGVAMDDLMETVEQ